MTNLLLDKIFDREGAVIVCDMDGVLVDTGKIIHDIIIDNADMYGNYYKTVPLTTEQQDARNHPYINTWMRKSKEPNVYLDGYLYESIADIDYEDAYPLEFAYFLIRKLEEDPTKKLYILSRCMKNAHTYKMKYNSEVFFGLESQVEFIHVSHEKNESKAKKCLDLGIDYDIYIDDELGNVNDMINLPMQDPEKTKVRNILIPMYGYNIIDQDTINACAAKRHFITWYDRYLRTYSNNEYGRKKNE